MDIKTNSLLKSIYVFHLAASPCNNCDIEILDCLTPKYDLERFGVQLVGSIRHADAILVSGVVNRKVLPIVKEVYEQAPKPVFVIAFGACGCSMGMFQDSYNTVGPVDKVIPVNAYIPGCPPRPEAIIDGLVKLIAAVKKGKK
ncbi:MAG: NADH-quinone oxidoreductase subunit NuoB [bacterium]